MFSFFLSVFSLKGGYLFAILDPLERTVQLGVGIGSTDSQTRTQNISVYYAADDDYQAHRKHGGVENAPLTSFETAALGKDWSRLAIKVME